MFILTHFTAHRHVDRALRVRDIETRAQLAVNSNIHCSIFLKIPEINPGILGKVLGPIDDGNKVSWLMSTCMTSHAHLHLCPDCPLVASLAAWSHCIPGITISQLIQWWSRVSWKCGLCGLPPRAPPQPCHGASPEMPK